MSEPKTAASSIVPGERCDCIWVGDDEHPEIGTSGDVPCGCGAHSARCYRETVVHWEGKHWTIWCAFRESLRRQAEATRLRADLAAVTADRDRLREAARPFEEYVARLDAANPAPASRIPDACPISLNFEHRGGVVPILGDLRRLADAVGGRVEGGEPR